MDELIPLRLDPARGNEEVGFRDHWHFSFAIATRSVCKRKNKSACLHFRDGSS